MTDDNKGGSGSSTPPPSGNAPGGEDGGKNKIAKLTIDQALAKLEQTNAELEEQKKLNLDLAAQLNEANKVLEAQEKAKFIGEILPRSTFKVDELQEMPLEDLKTLRVTLDRAAPPKVNSVRMGMTQDLSDRERGLTVGDLSVATELKRKGREAA